MKKLQINELSAFAVINFSGDVIIIRTHFI